MTTATQEPAVSVKSLLEAGVQFGHQTRRWDPRMKPFIFAERNGIHIIDLHQTVPLLRAAMDFVRGVAARGDSVLFVGTKKQAQDVIETEAGRANQPFVTNRWLGGTLTNFQTIEGRIDYLVRLEDKMERGQMGTTTKREAGRLYNEAERMNRYFGGIKIMKRLPGALFIVDPPMERIAVAEAIRMRIPIVAMCDTNCNPNEIDFAIPSNDDAIRAIRLVAGRIADAIIEGQSMQGYAGADDTSDDDVAALAASGTFSASPDDPNPAAPAEEPPATPPTG
jgi:small subunit ribosomal protein S2